MASLESCGAVNYADATGMVLSSVIDGQTLGRTNTAGLVTSFDTVGIFAPGTPGTFTFDDVRLAVTSVPEPSALTSAASGILAVIGIKFFRRSSRMISLDALTPWRQEFREHIGSSASQDSAHFSGTG
jgi:hypothetical protein